MTTGDELKDGQDSAEAAMLLRCMIAVASADGVLLGKELDKIGEIHAELSNTRIDRGEIAEQFLRWQNDGSPSIKDIVSPGVKSVGEQARMKIFKAACLIMLSDGHAAESERRRLAEIALALNVDVRYVIETLLDAR